MQNQPSLPPESELNLYQTEDGHTRIDVHFSGKTAWLSLNQISALFQRHKSVISKHIRNVFEERELARISVVAKFATTAADNKTYQVEYFNLDVILAVGYRVKSHRGTQFRIWATERLREYIVKGFAIDDQRLKNGGGGNYFRELLERIRDLRTSEKVFWRQVLDIYATSIDYDPSVDTTKRFFAAVQNKMHWAAHGKTAAETISTRVDATLPNMGLTSWSGDKPGKDKENGFPMLKRIFFQRRNAWKNSGRRRKEKWSGNAEGWALSGMIQGEAWRLKTDAK